uniref:Uncharacterized protein n=1 Tax=Anopheles minimus TaxID=112268 RepID=A0A182WNE8_9DIPT
MCASCRVVCVAQFIKGDRWYGIVRFSSPLILRWVRGNAGNSPSNAVRTLRACLRWSACA